MTILQSLNRYYDRMAARREAEAPGYSREKIGYAIILSKDGSVADVRDLHDRSGKKERPQLLEVPAAFKRTAGIAPNLFWDKTAYVLGRTKGEGRRTAEEHASFKVKHAEILARETDEGLVALRLFLETWTPERFDTAPFKPEMLDTNVVFALDGERIYLHQRAAARCLLANQAAEVGESGLCLVTGEHAPLRRLHPSIKGIEGAQSSGAALVSFNLDAFTSYGKEQGANAPVSDAAAFRYGAALNRMLDRGGKNRIARPIGDATIVFWADAADAESEALATKAESLFQDALDPPDDDTEAAKVRDAAEAVAQGRPAQAVAPTIAPGVRFHVLGLSPNAARLSVRFWLENDFAFFAERLAQHAVDLAIEPKPFLWGARPPTVWRLLVMTTAVRQEPENVPPRLAGEVMRAILTGGRYPQALLSTAIMRLRAGDDKVRSGKGENRTTGWHAAVIRAVLARDARLSRTSGHEPGATQEPPMSLQRDYPDPAYQLGRLFAVYETAQRMALGKVNATIRDRYFGAASATPATVFPLLMRGVQNHLSKLRKDGKGGWLERDIGEIADRLGPPLPRSLSLQAQGRFVIGYYHQRQAAFAAKPELANEDDSNEGDES
jgi:CRISPR-associated protein Csd1